jgi:hypothetical protein
MSRVKRWHHRHSYDACSNCGRPLGAGYMPRCPRCYAPLDPEPEPERPRSDLANAAGCLGLLALLAIPAPLALALGIAARSELKRHPEKSGMGCAIFAIIMGAFGTLVLVVAIAEKVFG